MRGKLVAPFSVAVAALLLLFAMVPAAFAAPPGWTVTQLTSGDNANQTAQVSGDRVVWQGYDGAHWQIHTWKLGDSLPTTLTRGPRDSLGAMVSGDRVVWTRSDGTNDQILTWKVGDSSPTTLTTDDHLHQTPQVSGDRVVWVGFLDATHRQIFTWKVGDSSPTTLTTGALWNNYEEVSGDRVVWQGNDGAHQQVFTWKAGDSSPTTLTTNALNNQTPQVSGDRIVWIGSDAVRGQVFTWKVGDSSLTTLTSDPNNHGYPQISGDRVVWQGMDGQTWQIYTWKSGDSTPTQVSYGAWANNQYPQISGDRIVWNSGGSNRQILTQKMGDSSATTLTTAGTDNLWPEVSGDHVVWNGKDENATFQVFDATYGTPPPPAVTYYPIAGLNRYGTAIAASRSTFATGACDAVVLATGRNYPDALGASGLAGAASCPVLLVDGMATKLDVTVRAEIDRVTQGKASRTVYIAGGTGAVSAGIQSALETAYGKPHVLRLAGTNRYTTAELVAKRAVVVYGVRSVSWPHKVIVATGADYHDALLAGPIAYRAHMPILLVGTSLDSGFKPTLTTMGATDAMIVGSTTSVKPAVATAIGTALGGAGHVTRPASQTNAYSQALAVANLEVSTYGFAWDGVGLATGENYPDALGAGPVMGVVGAPLLFTHTLSLDAAVASALTTHKGAIAHVRFFGGTGAVSQIVRTAVAKALK